MNIIRRIKNNRFVRGIYMIYRNYFGFSKKKFGYVADDVIITPPLLFF